MIDILINNAGALVRRTPITELTGAVFDDVIDPNVRSMMMCTRHAVPHMKNGGSIINLTSVAARTGGGPGASMHAASKGYISVATKGQVLEVNGGQYMP